MIDKTIRGLSTEELDSIVYENALIDPDEHVGAFISSHLLEFAIGAIAVLMLIIMLLVLYLRASAIRTGVCARRPAFPKLYSLTNEQLFGYSMGIDTLIMSNPSDTSRTWWTSKRESCPRTGRTPSSTTPTP